MLKLKNLEIVADEGEPGSAYLAIPSDAEDAIAVLEPHDVALAAAYLLRIAEEHAYRRFRRAAP